MVRKVLISPEVIRNNSFKLGIQLHQAGFLPTKIYAVQRGGVYIANPISEYFYYIYGKDGTDLKFGAVTAQSYNGIQRKRDVEIIGWSPALESVTPDDKVLVAEDIVDSGNTLSELINELQRKTPLKRNLSLPLKDRQIVVVAHDFKERSWKTPKFTPDLWAKKWEIDKPENDPWLHYMTHELEGLRPEEIEGYYGIKIK